MEIQSGNDKFTTNDDASTQSNVDYEEKKIGEDASSINVKSYIDQDASSLRDGLS